MSDIETIEKFVARPAQQLGGGLRAHTSACEALQAIVDEIAELRKQRGN